MGGKILVDGTKAEIQLSLKYWRTLTWLTVEIFFSKLIFLYEKVMSIVGNDF